MAYNVGILGATGAVGQEIIRLLNEREFQFPIAELRLLASTRSVGKTEIYKDKALFVQEATFENFEGLDVCIFSASGEQSRVFAQAAVECGCIVVDNSSAFRMDPNVPLVVPEINPNAVDGHKGIIANPNCSTVIALMGLYPLHKAFGLKRFVASTYQAVSGSGVGGLVELQKETESWDQRIKRLKKVEMEKEMMSWSGKLTKSQRLELEQQAKVEQRAKVYPHQIAFNLLPHVDDFLEDGYTREEMKMLNEGRKIMGLDELKVTCTCVRVPVFRAHSISVSADFEKPVSIEVAREAIDAFEGVTLVDNPEQLEYPMPLDYSEVIPCGVGRIRKDCVFDNGLAFWVTGDQLWKGAALNAIQIAELLHKKNLIG